MTQEAGASENSVRNLYTTDGPIAVPSDLIDGTEGGFASTWEAGLLEVTDYVSLTGHMFDYHYLIANGDFYDSLSEDYQDIIDTAAQLAVWTQNLSAMRE